MTTKHSQPREAHASAIPDDAYVIIIGAMKAGTSSLFSYLAEHPAICPACIKEPEWFSEFQSHKANIENYEDLWDYDPSQHRYVLEASTGYTKYPFEPEVPENIKRSGIRPKFIYVVRNPFERIESRCHFMMIKEKNHRWKPTDDAAIEVSKYYQQLERYHFQFPRSDILVLDFDELAANPKAAVKRVLRFLNLDDNWFDFSPEVTNKAKSVARWPVQLTGSRLRLAARMLPQPIKSRVSGLIAAWSPRGKRRLRPWERWKIRRALALDMKRLREEYNIDIQRWGFK
jgi:hypothetical protein